MESSQDNPSYEQQVYWRELVKLKADGCYIRDYRNATGRWVTSIAAIRAVASSGSIGAWVIWKQYAFIWASLIAVSQIADALKDVFPLYKRKAALSRWSRILDRLFVDAQRDWEMIAAGEYTNAQIRKLSHRIRLRKNKAEARFIPDGLAKKPALFARAETEAAAYFRIKYDSVVEGEDDHD